MPAPSTLMTLTLLRSGWALGHRSSITRCASGTPPSKLPNSTRLRRRWLSSVHSTVKTFAMRLLRLGLLEFCAGELVDHRDRDLRDGARRVLTGDRRRAVA